MIAVYVVYVEYYEDVIGVATDTANAKIILDAKCPRREGYSHDHEASNYYCGFTKFELNA